MLTTLRPETSERNTSHHETLQICCAPSVLLENTERTLLNELFGSVFLSGGCCFRPKTSKDGLKLFEIETVLSLELRKPKTKANPSAVTEVSGPVSVSGSAQRNQFKTVVNFMYNVDLLISSHLAYFRHI